MEAKKQYIKITHRDIAKMLCKAMPIEDQAYEEKIESYIEVIGKLKPEQKLALRCAYLFSAKVPREEREDFFQDIALALLKAKQRDEKLAYAIARCDWIDFWKKRHIRSEELCIRTGDYTQRHYNDCSMVNKPASCHDCAYAAIVPMVQSFDSCIDDGEGNEVALGELIIGEADFEFRLDGEIEAERIWNKLPSHIKPIVHKRLIGKPLTKQEHNVFGYWLKKDGYKLAMA